MYAQDHEELLPATATVWNDLNVDAGVLVCPTKGKSVPNGYGYNTLLSSAAMGDIKDPTSIPMTADAFKGTTYPNILTSAGDVDKRHSNKAILSYVDGHVAATDYLINIGDLPVKTGLVAYYRADVGATATTWSDQSGYKRDLLGTAGALMQFVQLGINGLPAMKSITSVSKPMIAAAPNLNLNDNTIVVVFNRLTNSGGLPYCRLGNSLSSGFRSLCFGGTPWINFRTNINWVAGGNQFNLTTPYCCTVASQGRTVAAYNGTALAPFQSCTFASDLATITNTIAVGGEADGGGGAPTGNAGTCDILTSEFLVYDHALTWQEQQKVTKYMVGKYAIQ